MRTQTEKPMRVECGVLGRLSRNGNGTIPKSRLSHSGARSSSLENTSARVTSVWPSAGSQALRLPPSVKGMDEKDGRPQEESVVGAR